MILENQYGKSLLVLEWQYYERFNKCEFIFVHVFLSILVFDVKVNIHFYETYRFFMLKSYRK